MPVTDAIERLRAAYGLILEEDTPPDMLALLDRLDELTPDS